MPKPGVEGETELAYLHLGRASDVISTNGGSIKASEYEAELRTLLEPRLAELGDWRLDTVQLFGNNLPSTALVVQLLGEKKLAELLLQSLREGVEGVNTKIGLAWPLKVDPYKRMLVLVKNPRDPTDHEVLYAGAGADDASKWDNLCLVQTHKQTLQRWKNVQVFKLWLDQLDWN